MNRDTAVTIWREVCGSDAVMAAMPPTGRMLEEFARRIEAVTLRAERPAIKPAAQVVALEPEGPDGHGVNWLAGKRPKPGDLLYADDAAARAEPARDAHRGGDSYEASMLRNLLARIHGDGGHYVEQHGLDKALEDADAKVVAWLAPVTTEQVVAAIYAVGAESARRCEMFPQTSDAQLETRHAIARVAELLQWYEANTGCTHLGGWPGA